MNVIFLDFDGVLDTNHFRDYNSVEEKIKILADICREYNCKVVIEACARLAINEETLEIDPDAEWVIFLMNTFKKYNIEVIGRTPKVRKYSSHSKKIYFDEWKEDAIRLYLFRHPEIEHFCIIDDDDLSDMYKDIKRSDLNKVRDYLVKTQDYIMENPEREGLLPEHKGLVGECLKKENNIRRLVLKYKGE